MQSPPRGWTLFIAAIALLCAGVVFAAGEPAAAQNDTQDHSHFTVLAGPFTAPQEVTAACLTCHYLAGQEVMASSHWSWEATDPVTGRQLGKNVVINNTLMAIAGNEPRCASCHVGYGYTGPSFFETATEVDVDCLVCHDSTGTYRKFPTAAGYVVLGEAREFPPGSGDLWEPVNLAAVAQSVAAPGRANCGSCHFADGDDAVRHGNLDAALSAPSRELDVHMGTDGLGFSCVSCHGGQDHAIAGRLYGGEAPVTCDDCHTGENAPHQDSPRRAALTQHTESVACQTCHIPEIARGQALRLTWDWSTAGIVNAAGQPTIETDAAGNVVYDTQMGSFSNESEVNPVYRWWNGATTFLTVRDTIDPNQVVPLNAPQGALGDGKITPFKRFSGVQPYDAGNNTLVTPNLFADSSSDVTAYWSGWDWPLATASGMASSGADFSGELGWITTEMLWAQNHGVAPAEEALACTDCHTRGGRLGFLALGFEPERARFLSALAEPDAGSPHSNLTRYDGPETCLTCHPEAGAEVAGSTHYSWLGVAQSVDQGAGSVIGANSAFVGLPTAVAETNWLDLLQPQDPGKPAQLGGCAQCHVGVGNRPNPPDALTEADGRNVDCLMCHGPNYARTVANVNGVLRIVPAPGIDVLEVVRNVQSPTSATCLRCHESILGGPGAEHGASPTLGNRDIHVSSGLQCVDCHHADGHDFPGSGSDEPGLALDCTTCHDGDHPTGFTAIDRHLDRVACQTCHIPAVARDPAYPALVAQDWTQSLLQENGLYTPVSELESGVVPVYRWWNGDAQGPDGPIGSIDDATARLAPWRAVVSSVPADAASGDAIPISVSTFAITGDLNAAVADGVVAAGVDYSGNWAPTTSELLFTLNHQVAPASEALRCPDCHTHDQGRLDFAALGYAEVRATDLFRAAPSDTPDAPPESRTTPQYRIEGRAYVGELDQALAERRQSLNLSLGIIGGIVGGFLLAILLAALVLRNRSVTRKGAVGWLREHRRGTATMVLLVLGSALVGWVSLHYLLEFTASTEFCGELCHATRAEYVTYHTSLHANVDCAECHVGPGLGAEFNAKLNGLRELWLYTTNSWERPIPSPVETLRPARDVCEVCHWPEVFYADRAIEIPHFANDEDNSRSTTTMLLKIGGGTERAGQGQGIHWHIENKVEYVATDPQRQIIPWVRAEIDGKVVTYVDVTNPLTEDQLAQYEVREMDCIDCHNRASHIFRSSNEMLDEALANGVLPTDLPYLRREAWNALEAGPDEEAAIQAIEAIPAFYQASYPSIYGTQQDVLADVVQELKDMYAISHFPKEQVFSTTYPDNLAHLEDPGCFRCHNGKHYAQADGDQSIRLHCTICHTIPQTVEEGEPAPEIKLGPAWQPPTHLSSTWIADHRYTFDGSCVDCHEEETFCANQNCHGRSWPYVNLSVSNPPFAFP
ncbi:MAG: tetrathionate reductase family octaheme c-type cytochrome [Anaerolineae bacterium]|nr:tetrathionate reductase family octaheme c-type cytochrome [Anaerolineae bacterium]